jgi:hypothetical protein
MDKISCLVILRALFIFLLIEKGWIVKRVGSGYQLSKSVKKGI